MISDQQLQAAAVIFCRLTGINPDAPFEGGGKNQPKITNWMAARSPILDHLALHHAIGAALSGKPLPEFEFKPGKGVRPPRPTKQIVPFRNGSS